MANSETNCRKFSTPVTPYVSCIRIHGLRILPPILTEEKRNQMNYYKELAIKIEAKLKKISNDSTDLSGVYVDSDTSSISDSVIYSSDKSSIDETTYKSQIFSEGCNQDVLKLLKDNTPLIDKISNVPLKSDKNEVNISKEDGEVYKNKNNSGKFSPPTLIRSNSYILETPSPVLLALMKQQNQQCSPEKTNDSSNRKRRSWDLVNAREKWSSIEHDLNVVADRTSGSKFISLPPSPHNKMFNSHLEIARRSESQNLQPEKEKNLNTKFIKSSIEQKPKKAIESPVKKTDLSLSNQISSHSQLNSAASIILPRKPDILSCETSETQIREIIEKIHNEQSKQMSELIARQQKEQENLMKVFAEQQATLLSKLRNNYRNSSTKIVKMNNYVNEANQEKFTNVVESDVLKNSESLLSECKRLLHENINNSDDNLFTTASSSPDNVTLTNFSTKSDIFPSKENSARYSNSFSVDSLEPPSNSNFTKSADRIRKSFCSRQLFPSKKEVWAATKINALVRGYLVRRLIKTERIQNLIKTIRDTLVCAMELHHETADNIQPADVELHRRLIQQVTAACYSFHDTFFELSRSDQLSIIATDRERQKEKSLRPTSAKSNSTLSSTTQRVLERKLRRKSTDSTSGAPSRSSSSRSCYSAGEFRVRTKSLGLTDSVSSSSKTSPQNDVMRRAMSYGANKKPWR